MYYRQFYSELAKLFYAVACIDGRVSGKEKKDLMAIVRRELVPAEQHTDNFGTDAAYYTEIEFDFLEESMLEPEAAFDSFLSYIDSHHSAIDKRMRDMTIRVAKKIANTYHKTSRKEAALIRKLEKSLNCLPDHAHK